MRTSGGGVLAFPHVTPFTAVVMAAGQGTRMRSSTPKVLHELCGRPMVAWPVLAAQEAGAQRVVVVTSPGVDLDGALPEGATTAVQPEPNGTGGAVEAAMPQVGADDVVVVLSGDVPLIASSAIHEVVAAHREARAAATVVTTELGDPAGYGRVVRTQDGTFDRIVETKREGDATSDELAIREINTGIYVFEASALQDALPQLTTNNAQQELYLPQALTVLKDRGVAVHQVDDPAVVLGVNDRVQLAEVRAIAQRRILEEHMRNGVTVVDPASTYVDATVTLGQDTRLEPQTALHGATTVGAGAHVGPQVTAVDSTIEDGATVRVAWLEQAHVGPRATVGPFAFLRPNAHLHEGAKAGTFVEIKNSEIGAGSKVPHLSYIGDATVGPGSNLGAATITANYDSKRKAKNRTTLGAGVKTGVDTTLVAPVTLHDRAYTAAGSVISEDVPEGALGIARERQQNIEGYADRP
ncbi:MAG: bifunctional UDP-N-acetylglucosamine diphosphorylase/glucosamine-1-phosphate N-acetyltransferase GlmU [Solirubrobacterales bacterium]|nr:bifunctional UDP-N-acetylglucosamine diphosphorylase/glucosamine-1-phosphate N-acetyltransferase GlmU [Solirubrobacterales bacterium]